MEKKLILHGVFAGAIAGLLAFRLPSRIFADGHQPGHQLRIGPRRGDPALDKAAGLPAPRRARTSSPDIQANIGSAPG